MDDRVDQFIKRHRLIPQGAVIVVGVSGGPDSMALLHYLYKRKALWKLEIIACTIDHQLRGDDSKEDAAYVARYCRKRGIPCEMRSVDVPGFRKKNKLGIEEAARILRYRVFEDVMIKHEANLLALAHHGDDQIETMLMRQVRGSFGLSKAGIPVRRPFAGGELIRPFLTVSKEEIENYCQTHGIEVRRDPTNASEAHTRNRFRHHVLPFLKKENPKVHLRFQQDSELMTDDYTFLDDLAREALPKIVEEKTTNAFCLSINRLKAAPVPLQRRMIHLILNYLNNNDHQPAPFEFVHIESILRWLDGKSASGRLDLPHRIVVERSYDQCWLKKGMREATSAYEVPLTIPGLTTFPSGQIQADVCHTYSGVVRGPQYFICDYDKAIFPLMVRSRKPGDRFHPAGLVGTKKLKKLFIDQKIPRELRDAWPVVIDGNGDILWVPLLAHGACSIRPETSRFLCLAFEPTDNFRRICNEGRFTGDTDY